MMSSSNDVHVLQTFTGQPVSLDLSRLLAGCKTVEQFKKVKRIGEGTYGTVCKLKLAELLLKTGQIIQIPSQTRRSIWPPTKRSP